MEGKVHLRSHDGFQYLLGESLLTKSLLQSLFNLETYPYPPYLVSSVSLDVVKPDDQGHYPLDQLKERGAVYVVLPSDVVDNSDSEPEEFKPQEPSRKRMEVMKKARFDTIQRFYKRLHPDIYTFDMKFLVPSLVEAISEPNSNEKLISLLKKESPTGIYSLDFFTAEFCNKLVEEVENFEKSGLPINRPNSMNNYGLILEDIGMGGFCDQLVIQVMSKIGSLLYPNYSPAQSLDSHHSFIVQYKMDEDQKLDLHFDDSHVTLNVCLGRQFTAGDLFFCGLYDDETTHSESFYLQHNPGRGVIHLGLHRHAATEISSGERYNFIMWCRSHYHRSNCTCGKDHSSH